MTEDKQPETTEDQRPVEHPERPGYGVTAKFPVPADETPATTEPEPEPTEDPEDDK